MNFKTGVRKSTAVLDEMWLGSNWWDHVRVRSLEKATTTRTSELHVKSYHWNDQ